MDLWQILVLGVVRLGLDADWDRMEDLANHHLLLRQMLGVPATPWGADAKTFGHQTLRDNVALLDDQLLRQINAPIAAAGREVFAKNDGAQPAALAVKVDSYVLETDVHFPTDLNLLWDAGRKCVDLVEGLLASGFDLPGWRKCKLWRRQLKACERAVSHVVHRGGPNKEARVKRAAREYLSVCRALSAKVHQSHPRGSEVSASLGVMLLETLALLIHIGIGIGQQSPAASHTSLGSWANSRNAMHA